MSEPLAPLKEIITAGEQLQITPAISRLFARLPDCSLHNHYGPTECHVVTALRLPPDVQEWPALPSIGRPIANTQIYILDEQRQLVPAGVPGELFIGGRGVAQGYLGKPDLTAERFLTDPFRDDPEARMYRTGDLAVWRLDGAIECLGRIDHQVKIRGFRIEIGEVEATLGQHPAVREAAVIAREDVPGNKRLVAYIVPAREEQPSPAQLRDFMGRSLPDYMVPLHFVLLERLPLTPSGKVDRKSLPAPDAAVHRERPLIAPRNQMETMLTGVWENAFGISPISVDDDFFELGGHSLLAGRLLAAISQTIGRELPLASFLTSPTIRQQASELERISDAAHWKSLVGMKPNGSRPPLFGLHAGQGTILFYRHLIRHLHPDQPFYGLQQQGLDGRRTPFVTIEDMANHYIQEIREVRPHGPYHLIGYCLGGLIAYEMARQLSQQGEEVGIVAQINTPGPHYDYTKLQAAFAEAGEETERRTPQRRSRSRAGRLLARVVNKLGRMQQIAHVKLRRCVPTLALTLGRPVPLEYRRAYILNINDRAEPLYKPAPYPGPLLVIHGEHLFDDPSMPWPAEALGGVERHIVEGRHTKFADMVSEPYVQKLAEILEAKISA